MVLEAGLQGRERCEEAEEGNEQHMQDENPGERFRGEGGDV